MREELLKYNPRLAELCREVLSDTELRYNRSDTRLTGHLKGYDPTNAPRFEWSERPKEPKASILRNVQRRSLKSE